MFVWGQPQTQGMIRVWEATPVLGAPKELLGVMGGISGVHRAASAGESQNCCAINVSSGNFFPPFK